MRGGVRPALSYLAIVYSLARQSANPIREIQERDWVRMEKRIEVVFAGTPADFAVMAEEFTIATFRSYGGAAYVYSGGLDVPPEVNPVLVIVGLGLPRLYARAHRIAGRQSLLSVTGEENAWENNGRYWETLLAEMHRQGWVKQKSEQPTPEEKTPDGDEPPDMPPIPGQNGATWDDTFDWYYRMGRGICPTLKKLAGLIGMGEGTVYNNHIRYKAQYGERPMNPNE